MVDFDCKTKMVQSPPPRSPKIASRRSMPILSPPSLRVGEFTPAPDPLCSAYESYLRLPELRRLWESREFPGWDSEPVIKPALQALEITFRFVSVVLSDARPYLNRREWDRWLEALARDQVDLISTLCCEDDEGARGAAPTVDLRDSFGVVVPHTGSSAEVWRLSAGDHDTTVVSRTSESSLLPRLATWHKSESISSRILYAVESAMKRCPYTLGLGEPNLDGKPNLDYDAVCRPAELHAIKRSTLDHAHSNPESHTLFTIHQIFESWVFTARKLLGRAAARVKSGELGGAADDCWVVERIWKLLEEIQSLHLLMDPDDFLHLKAQLKMKASSSSENFCFRSRGLMEAARASRDLRHTVPGILAVEVDPMGGPVVQEAAMGAYRDKGSFQKVHLLQAFQGVESGVKRFFFCYRQLLTVMMGSLEANAGRPISAEGSDDALAQVFLGPTYYPSLDGAKTFVGDFWEHHHHDRTAKNGRATIGE